MGQQRRGFVLALLAYLSWGFFPLYWQLLAPAGAFEILAHRIVWTLIVVAILVAATRRLPQLRVLARDRRKVRFLAVGAVVIAINWGMYILGVLTGHVVETSLGYFINPLVTIVLGVLVLGERLRWFQWLALAVAASAVVELTFDYGQVPWLSLTLACSFGTYGLMKKKADVGTVEGLTVETVLLAPIALGYLLITGFAGHATFGHFGLGNAIALAGTGIITAIPLLCFGAAATRVPLTTMGLLQYLVPSIQFTIGLVVFHESMTTARWVGFGLVWLALAMITAESLLVRRKEKRTILAQEQPVAATAT
ncbi:EamA family transporter RarD [Labedaea rhizosphaerae]|uniref:Chloramphenicol-sensitive protein RarD n=1 Tax=Labedaea rhizosphaerae TaxID=598644 RepID=A0A4R6SHT1_LABRH|nr:EamA family transporter RarD [Labedaea rhizosphaerae]TDQ01375.1 chloramphenicol-sensitive protein RarD [Labedaea rhizosphaerae]